MLIAASTVDALFVLLFDLRGSLAPRFASRPCARCNTAAEGNQADNIRENHELVEHIGKFPDQIIREQ